MRAEVEGRSVRQPCRRRTSAWSRRLALAWRRARRIATVRGAVWATVFEGETRAPAEVAADPVPSADAVGLGLELELDPVLALPELARDPALPGRDGVGTDGEDGTPGVLGIVTVGGAGL
jgi:hypothetical protein